MGEKEISRRGGPLEQYRTQRHYKGRPDSVSQDLQRYTSKSGTHSTTRPHLLPDRKLKAINRLVMPRLRLTSPPDPRSRRNEAALNLGLRSTKLVIKNLSERDVSRRGLQRRQPGRKASKALSILVRVLGNLQARGQVGQQSCDQAF